MFVKQCPECEGKGWIAVEHRRWFGLKTDIVSEPCPECGGSGEVEAFVPCSICDGQGLLGETSDVCPTCNGKGTCDEFGLVPRSQLKPGTSFTRRCRFCHNFARHTIVSEIMERQRNITWEKDESLRKVETFEVIRIRCESCGHEEDIRLDPNYHHEPGERRPVEEVLAQRSKLFTGNRAQTIEW